MTEDDGKKTRDSNRANAEQPGSSNVSSSTPDNNIQAPQSSILKKSVLSNTSPDENVQAPKSKWLTEGFDIGKAPEEDK
jgi:hypothetical protein